MLRGAGGDGAVRECECVEPAEGRLEVRGVGEERESVVGAREAVGQAALARRDLVAAEHHLRRVAFRVVRHRIVPAEREPVHVRELGEVAQARLAGAREPRGVGLRAQRVRAFFAPALARVGEQTVVEEQQGTVLDQEALRIDLDALAARHRVRTPAAVGRRELGRRREEQVAVGGAREAVRRPAVDGRDVLRALRRLTAACGEVGDGVEAADREVFAIEVRHGACRIDGRRALILGESEEGGEDWGGDEDEGESGVAKHARAMRAARCV